MFEMLTLLANSVVSFEQLDFGKQNFAKSFVLQTLLNVFDYKFCQICFHINFC